MGTQVNVIQNDNEVSVGSVYNQIRVTDNNREGNIVQVEQPVTHVVSIYSGPRGIQGPPGSGSLVSSSFSHTSSYSAYAVTSSFALNTPIIGLSELGFGNPSTGAITSSANFKVFPSNELLNIYGTQGNLYLGKMASNIYGIQSSNGALGLYGPSSYSTLFLNDNGIINLYASSSFKINGNTEVTGSLHISSSTTTSRRLQINGFGADSLNNGFYYYTDGGTYYDYISIYYATLGLVGGSFGLDLGAFGQSQISTSNTRIRLDRVTGLGHIAFDISGIQDRFKIDGYKASTNNDFEISGSLNVTGSINSTGSLSVKDYYTYKTDSTYGFTVTYGSTYGYFRPGFIDLFNGVFSTNIYNRTGDSNFNNPLGNGAFEISTNSPTGFVLGTTSNTSLLLGTNNTASLIISSSGDLVLPKMPTQRILWIDSNSVVTGNNLYFVNNFGGQYYIDIATYMQVGYMAGYNAINSGGGQPFRITQLYNTLTLDTSGVTISDAGNGTPGTKITSLAGTGSRLVEANSTGSLSATSEIIEAQLYDNQIIAYLTTGSNWSTGSYDAYLRKYKDGIVDSSSFGGDPWSASITLSPPFPSNNYSIVVTGEDARTWSISNRLSGSFTINSNSSTPITGSTFYQAVFITSSIEVVGNSYIGPTFTGSYQGQFYYDSNYKYFAVANNTWVRTILS